ncbi:MAG: iron-sulfur cluster assembly scaffold protein [Candidatus Babeliales bacterium]
MYKKTIIDHYQSPRNRESLACPTHSSDVLNPSCGDTVIVALTVVDGIITAISQQARGCVLSVAASSLLSEYIKGKTVADIAAVQADAVQQQLLGMTIGPVRLRCATLSVLAIKKALLIS